MKERPRGKASVDRRGRAQMSLDSGLESIIDLSTRTADLQEGNSQFRPVKHDECWKYSPRVAVAGVVGRAGGGSGPGGGGGGRGEVAVAPRGGAPATVARGVE
jgi:hypothetical protein